MLIEKYPLNYGAAYGAGFGQALNDMRDGAPFELKQFTHMEWGLPEGEAVEAMNLGFKHGYEDGYNKSEEEQN